MKIDLLKKLLEEKKHFTIITNGREIGVAPDSWDFFDKSTLIVRSNGKLWFVDVPSISATISY